MVMSNCARGPAGRFFCVADDLGRRFFDRVVVLHGPVFTSQSSVYVSSPTKSRHRTALVGNEASYFGQNEPKIFDRMRGLKAEAGLFLSVAGKTRSESHAGSRVRWSSAASPARAKS